MSASDGSWGSFCCRGNTLNYLSFVKIKIQDETCVAGSPFVYFPTYQGPHCTCDAWRCPRKSQNRTITRYRSFCVFLLLACHITPVFAHMQFSITCQRSLWLSSLWLRSDNVSWTFAQFTAATVMDVDVLKLKTCNKPLMMKEDFKDLALYLHSCAMSWHSFDR